MDNTMDLTLLKTFFEISVEEKTEPALSVPAVDLLKAEAMGEALRHSGEMLKATGVELPASFLGMNFFNLIASKQLVLGLYNRMLDLPLDNLTFHIVDHGDHIHGGFRIHELRWKEASAVDREAWLAGEWTSYFQTVMNPMLDSVAWSAGVKPDLIWNQFAGQMRFCLDYMEETMGNPEIMERFQRDYELLLRLAPEVFNRKRNPFEFKPRYLDSPYSPGKKLIMRSSCCMYDKRENGVKCYSCPRLLPAEREEMKTKIESAAAAKV